MLKKKIFSFGINKSKILKVFQLNYKNNRIISTNKICKILIKNNKILMI